MAQVQFRSDDSQKWGQNFGTGAAGVYTPATSTDSPTKTTFSGSSNALTGTVGSNSGFAVGDIVLIHQSRNGGGGAGTWMLNYIVGIAGTTFTFLYNLVANFDTTAQIQKIPQYSQININSGITLTGASWDGSTGGIVALMANGPINIAGTIRHNGSTGTSVTGGLGDASSTTVGGGYYGGYSTIQNNSVTAQQGEGTAGAQALSSSANGNGGGGGACPNSANSSAGGGGGNGTYGIVGDHSSYGGEVGGAAGTTAGNANLTNMVFGGGGGGAAFNTSGRNTVISGSSGAGIIILIGRIITVTGSVLANGGSSVTGGSTLAGGAGGGGSILFKGQTIILGNNLVTASGGTGTGGSGGTSTGGAPGGIGRIHIDYGRSLSGITTPTVDSRQDSLLMSQSGVQIVG